MQSQLPRSPIELINIEESLTRRRIQRRVTSQPVFGLPSPPWMAFTFCNKMKTIRKILLLIGSFGVVATTFLILWFVLRSDYYFPGRYETAFSAFAYIGIAWAGYGFTCANFFFVEALSKSRARNKRNKQDAEQAGAGQPAIRPDSKSQGSDKLRLESESLSR